MSDPADASATVPSPPADARAPGRPGADDAPAPGLLGAAVAAAVAAHPEATAVVEVGPHGERAWSWAQLAAAADAARAELTALGVGPGETVAYQLPNRLEFVSLTLAIVELGATCMPLMPIFREHELAFMLAEAAPRVLYVPDRFRGHDHLSMARGLAAELPSVKHVIALPDTPREASPRGPADRLGPRAGSADQLVDLLFTSGTSGEPKGALHRHDRLMAAVNRHVEHFGLCSEDVIFSPAPLAHQTGFLYGMWLALSLGATLVLQEVWERELGFATLERHGVSFCQAATPFLADLVEVAERHGRVPTALRTFVATGAAVPRELARRARVRLGAEVGGGFGSTETCMAAAFAPGADPGRAADTDGVAMAGVTLRVVDDAGTVLGPGVEGHFEIATTTLFSGYLNRPELTAAALTADGFYRTGDLAVIDADGALSITGRVKDVINRGGEKVPVAEVEQLLYGLPGVREVAVVAMPDPRLVERACAFLALTPGHHVDLAAVRAHLDAHRLAKPYWPERVELLDALPKTPSGKIKKFLLREQAAALVNHEVV
ncbi:AMP-binding protein [Conexibacter sp. DBS9H8]|uniref:AMP-binding protein n=1 Tax=Conexibacter sp. DBS9H8 TaxID=2937801 RepID=UPI00200F91CF|nr:AMP-binding protein [Conexibacter sp. DBS9H8]